MLFKLSTGKLRRGKVDVKPKKLPARFLTERRQFTDQMGGDSWGSHRGAAKEALIFQKWKINARKTPKGEEKKTDEKRTTRNPAPEAETSPNKLASVSCAQAVTGGFAGV